MQGIYLVICMAPILLYGLCTAIVYIGYLCAAIRAGCTVRWMPRGSD